MKETIMCPPYTKCRDCDVTQCPRKKEQYIPSRANGKSKLFLCEIINKADLPQEQKDEIIKVINEIY